MVPYDCQLHHDVKADIVNLSHDVRDIRSRLASLRCHEHQVILKKLDDELMMLKKEINEINKERYMARGIVILLAAIGSMIGSLIINYVK